MYLEFQRRGSGTDGSRPFRTPLLAGLAASITMSALGPVAPDGVLGGLLAGSLGVMLHLMVPAAPRSMAHSDPTEIPSAAPGTAGVVDQREAA